MKTLLLIFTILLSGCVCVNAQNAVNNCPEVKVVGPDYLTKPGETAIFTASIGNHSQVQNLEYTWAVSVGVITKGQRTSSITVSTRREDENSNLTATVKIAGFPHGCPDSASDTVAISSGIYDLEVVDEFGRLPKGDIMARIENLFIRLDRDPKVEGIIDVRFMKKESRQQKMSYLNNLFSAIVLRKKGLTRVTFEIWEDDDETRARLWLGLPGEERRYSGTDSSELIKGEDLKAKMKTLFLKK